MVKLKLNDFILIENCRSNSKKHAIRTLVYIFNRDKFEEWKNYEIKQKLKPTYAKGECYYVKLPEKGLIIYLRFLKNIKNMVLGRILVIENQSIVLELKYRKLKLKKIKGNENYYQYVKLVLDHLKIPIKRINLR